jgi:hypothetical protein
VEEENGVKWRLTRIYGESKAGEKENTWKILCTLHGQSNLPWLCVEDFNEILFAGEKEGGGSGLGVHGCFSCGIRGL